MQHWTLCWFVYCSVSAAFLMQTSCQEEHTLHFSGSAGGSAVVACSNGWPIVGMKTHSTNEQEDFNLTISCNETMFPSGSPLAWFSPFLGRARCPAGAYMTAINATAVSHSRRNQLPVAWQFRCKSLPPTHSMGTCAEESQRLKLQQDREVQVGPDHVITEIDLWRKKWRVESCSVVKTACHVLPFQNGHIFSSNDGLVALGTTITFSCHLSYVLVGPSNSTCEELGLTEWSEVPHCKRLDEGGMEVQSLSGCPVLLLCPVTWHLPLEYTWHKSDQHMWREIIPDNSTFTLLHNGSLVVANATLMDSGWYHCNMTDGIETGSYLTHLQVTLPPSPPAFIDIDHHDFNVYIVFEGSGTRLDCRMSGHPRPVITWFGEDYVLLSRNPQHRVHFAGNGSLFFDPVLVGDTGIYTCKGQNEVGVKLVSFILFVEEP